MSVLFYTHSQIIIMSIGLSTIDKALRSLLATPDEMVMFDPLMKMITTTMAAHSYNEIPLLSQIRRQVRGINPHVDRLEDMYTILVGDASDSKHEHAYLRAILCSILNLSSSALKRYMMDRH